MNSPHPSATHLSRRHFLADCGIGLGKIAAAGLLAGDFARRTSAESAAPINPLAPKHTSSPAKAISKSAAAMDGSR